MQLLHRSRQRMNHSGLPYTRQTHHHHTMSNHDCLHQLNDLRQELWRFQVVRRLQLLLNAPLQVPVIYILDNHSGEQVLDDPLEEWEIMLQKFGYVRVSHRSNQYNIFRFVGVSTSQ